MRDRKLSNSSACAVDDSQSSSIFRNERSERSADVVYVLLGVLFLIAFIAVPLVFPSVDAKLHPVELVRYVTAMSVLLGLVSSFPVGDGCCRLVRCVRATGSLPIARCERIAGAVAGVLFLAFMCFVPRTVALAVLDDRISLYANQLEVGTAEFVARRIELNDEISRRKAQIDDRTRDIREWHRDRRRDGDRRWHPDRHRVGREFMQASSELEPIWFELSRLREIERSNGMQFKMLVESQGRYRPQYR